jgi:NAD+ kinase
LKKLAKGIKRVGLIGNSEKASAHSVVNAAARLVARAGRRVYSDAATAQIAGFKSNIYPTAAELIQHVDLLLVFGGDGTMLQVASEVAGSRTPILGVNIGGLGFLTAVSSREMPKALRQLWNGDFTLDERALIQVGGKCHGRPIHQTALNDFVMSRVDSRLIILEVTVDDVPLTRYRCDGLIVSSPTGSTAYSLSAGGAVVHPQADVFEITPICPHTLSNRSVIVSLDSQIHVKIISPHPSTMLSADGQRISDLSAGDILTICRSGQSIRLVRLKGSSFFETLRGKLHWSGANV